MNSLKSTLLSYIALCRLNRPIGIWLLFFPCLWALLIADSTLPPLPLVAMFGVGAAVMRSAGCTYNDMIDYKIDAQVQRTRHRPIAAGKISHQHALYFLLAQLVVGLVILLQLPPQTIFLGVTSVILVFIYPWMKRLTYWPQAFLGLTYGWGVLMAWTARGYPLNLTAFLLYGAVICWVIGYDTIYGHQDREDDLLIGVKSTALLGGKHPRFFLAFPYGAAFGLLWLTGVVNHLNLGYFAGVIGVGLHFTWQVVTVNFNDPADCLAKFKSNTVIGWGLSIVLLVAQQLR